MSDALDDELRAIQGPEPSRAWADVEYGRKWAEMAQRPSLPSWTYEELVGSPTPETRAEAIRRLLAEGEALRRERGLTTFEGYITERREDLARFLTDCDPGDGA